MRKLNIEITKAQLKSFQVSFDETKDRPEVSATICLYTEQGKEITQYSIFTDCWNKEQKFELPIDMYSPIYEIGKGLEILVTRHCREGQLSLNAPEQND